MSLPLESAMKPDLIGDDDELPTTSKSGGDVFGEIDKRLGMLLDRANKLELTLARLNENPLNEDNDMFMILSGEEEYSFEDDIESTDPDDWDLEAPGSDNNDVDAGPVEKIDLNANED
ncbi:hypothetical protein KR093_007863 [Drosophila rubida]|uniref:Uncharacterized protein n=1 Tax=Drosophila rubida TaxID=30044 RepID=A0AAD4PLU5_9MUSC|nr:hypothetical protein KR093_007863 [Drosophila rubida]